jgi:hypothetical protein
MKLRFESEALNGIYLGDDMKEINILKENAGKTVVFSDMERSFRSALCDELFLASTFYLYLLEI